MRVILNSETRVAESIGAQELALRCGDVAFWDSTHNVSRYAYKLSTVCLIDSEAKARPILFHMTLNEREKNYSDMLNFWVSSIMVPFPSNVFTDGDAAMSAAISSFPNEKSITVLTCVFHLFDQNVKKKVLPVLTANGKGSSSVGYEFRTSSSESV